MQMSINARIERRRTRRRKKNLTCFVDDDFQMTSLRSRGDRHETPVVGIAEIRHDAALVCVSVQDFVHEVNARSVLQQLVITFFRPGLKPEFKPHFYEEKIDSTGRRILFSLPRRCSLSPATVRQLRRRRSNDDDEEDICSTVKERCSSREK